ncbi:MAG: cbb3-type cytochrome c oxidase subunit I, partial [Chlamydiia bacterium]|nr:cbb3-type cytochrome c oxidase subunit I [Chlamydiia bacterium]
HNTQWIMFTHVHTALLIGLTMTLYAAIYTMWPLLTNDIKLYSQRIANWHFWLHLLGALGMSFFMGMSAMSGALRRYIYVNGEYNTFMILAAICGGMMFVAWVLYLYNVIMSFGLKGLVGIFTPSKLDTKELLPE